MKPHICFVALNAYSLLSQSRSLSFIGGAELQQVIVARLLQERGFIVSFVCLDHGQPDTVEVDGVVVHRAFRAEAGLPGLRFIFPRLISVWRALSRTNADIYYHRTAGMLTGIVAAFCKRHGKRSIFAAAGDPDFERPTPRIRFARDRNIFEYGVRNVDQIVVQNENQHTICRQNYGREAVLIPNCLPKPDTDKQTPGRYVLWVSTIRALKQPQLMIEIAERQPQLKFVMIGGEDQFERPFYESIKDQASRVQNLDFLGYLPFEQTDEYFDDAALIVNTSESEGFPNTFLQAWARAIPTISFVDCGATLDGQRIGLQAGSLREMIDLIDELMDDDYLRKKHGHDCYNYYLGNNSPDVVIDKYEKLLLSMYNPPG